MNKLLKYLRGNQEDRNKSSEGVFTTQEQYYTHLFTESPDWKTPEPNYEEELRWQIIKNYVFFIKGYFAGSTKYDIVRPRILDIGCGRGWLTNLLSQFGDIKGIEPIGPVVKYANLLFPDIDITEGDIDSVLKKNEKFDIIVCSEVIEHIPDEEKADFLKKLNRVLHDDGFLIITTPRKDVQELWLRYSQPGQPIEEWLDEATLEVLLSQCKFKKHLLSRFAIPPKPDAPEIEIYQLWLSQKTM
jgi:2-polyprenyl-3-methyl-5-hydroxy-6-metoxy-1,4-benzoquinol methylase